MKNYLILFALVGLSSGCAVQQTVSDKDIDLYCQRLNVLHQKAVAISSNIANIKTTRTVKGSPYKRKIISNCHEGFCQEIEDSRGPIFKYEPKHPDANKEGYVAYPNITLEEEQADQKKWELIYTDVYKYAPVTHEFFLKDPKAKMCFDKYPFVDERYNFQKYFNN
ncbi:MAG: hypothetical protein PHY93_13750 [Bacteriovorax sp.]|nr:hypothetical protein [Bacteriovorax sp.]